MPTYNHVQEAKKAVQLPIHEGEQLGVCLTCKYWEVEEKRVEMQTPKLSLCVQPQFKDYALIVSGSSGCDQWQKYPNLGPDAEAYAHRGEAA